MKTILCYGDSNTYGYNPENGFRYPYDLRWTSILEKNMEGRARVIPEGLNGRTTCFEDEIRPGRNGFCLSGTLSPSPRASWIWLC